MEKVPTAGSVRGDEKADTGTITERGVLRVAIEGCCHGTLDEIYSESLPDCRGGIFGSSHTSSQPAIFISSFNVHLYVVVRVKLIQNFTSVTAEAIEETQANNGYKIDLLLICGDFQACRNEQDLNCMVGSN